MCSYVTKKILTQKVLTKIPKRSVLIIKRMLLVQLTYVRRDVHTAEKRPYGPRHWNNC